jgi:hypothetical protein
MKKNQWQSLSEFEKNLKTPISSEILNAYKKLLKPILQISETHFFENLYDGTGGKVSAAKIISYQIGWGTFLLTWYKSGVANKKIVMPGDGFDTWNYKKIAVYFYQKYASLSQEKLLRMFECVVRDIVLITEKEYASGNLDTIGVWQWCRLKSGKEWPLSKWIRVNTIAPYKRAALLITRQHH